MPLRNFPSVNELLESPALKQLVNNVSRNVVVDGVRQFLDGLRNDVQSAVQSARVPTPAELAQKIADWIASQGKQPLRPLINATGVLLPAIGRAPLSESAVEAIRQSAAGYTSLGFATESTAIAANMSIVEPQLTTLTGAEGALVVSNRAGGILLALAATAGGREVIVSRGELIALEGGRSLPDLAACSGAVLREVGTTNCTRLEDYERAINDKTAAILRVRPADYCVVGASQNPSLAELVTLARRHNLTLIDDLESATFINLENYGLGSEPVVGDSIQGGANLVLVRGDELIGGPACGIIVGGQALIRKLNDHPLAAALRVDRLVLTALAATINAYTTPESAERQLPLLSLLALPSENLRNRAERLMPQLAAMPRVGAAEVVQDVTYLRGFRVPGQEIPTWRISLQPAKGTVEELAAVFRDAVPSVIGRIDGGRLQFDLRSVFPRQDMEIAEVAAALGAAPPPPPAPEPVVNV